ncbi:MAG: PAS domain-containing protein [Bacteroidia bacterium]
MRLLGGVRFFVGLGIVFFLGWGAVGTYYFQQLKRQEDILNTQLRAYREDLQHLREMLWAQLIRGEEVLSRQLLLSKPYAPENALKALEPGYKAGIYTKNQILNFRNDLLEVHKTFRRWEATLKETPEKNQLQVIASLREDWRVRAPIWQERYDKHIEGFEKAYQAYAAVQIAQLHQRQNLGFYGTVAAFVVGIILLALIALLLRQKVSRPLQIAHKRLLSQEPLPKGPAELGKLFDAYNELYQKFSLVHRLLEELAEGQKNHLLDEVATRLPLLAGYVKGILAQIERLEKQLSTEQKKSQAQLKDAQEEIQKLALQLDLLRLDLGALTNLVPLLELDPTGKILSHNDGVSQIFPEIPKHVKALPLAVQEAVQKGMDVQGYEEKGLTPLYYAVIHLRDKRYKIHRVWVALLPLSFYAERKAQWEKEVATLRQQLLSYEESLNQLRQRSQSRIQDLQQRLETHLRHRNVLLQYLRLKEVSDGAVYPALQKVAELTATVAPEGRLSFWLLDGLGNTLHCLEAYDMVSMAHVSMPQWPKEEVPWAFEALHKKQALTIEAPLHRIPTEVPVLQLHPLYMDGEVVGALVWEGFQPRARWDEEFLSVVSQVVSLTLEQGERKSLERELMTYLEQSQALEEELRQNIEELEATAEEMRRTQSELRGQIAALNAAAIVSETDPEGTILYVNQAFLDTYYLSLDEIIGRTHRVIKSDYHPSAFFDQLWETLRKKQTWYGEVCNQTREGKKVWVLQTITPVLNAYGEVYKYIAVSFDITKQKMQEAYIQEALEAALEQERLLRETAQELGKKNEELRKAQIELTGQIEALTHAAYVFETGEDGRFTYLSPSFLEATGWKREELLGRSYMMIFSDRQPVHILQAHLRMLQQGEFWKGEVELRKLTGGALWAIMASTPVRDLSNGRFIKAIHVLFDISEQKNQEFRLKAQQNSLSELAMNPAVREGDVEKGLPYIAQLTRHTLQADRVSIWLYQENNMVTCVAVDEKKMHTHHVGAQVSKDLYPIYFQSVEREGVIAVVDSLTDLRTRELALPLLMPNNVASVLDASIRVGGKPMGLISVEMHHQRHQWNLDEVQYIVAIAQWISSVIETRDRAYAQKLQEAYQELRKANEELEEFNRSIKESIQYARRLQRVIFPDSLMNRYLGDNYFIVNRPKDKIGGDFYWFGVEEGLYFIAVADGTGHGVPGAFLSVIGHLLLTQLVHGSKVLSPDEILQRLHVGVRRLLKQDEEESFQRDGMDIAILVLNPHTFELKYAGAMIPLYYYSEGELREIKPDKKPIGGEQLEEERTYTCHRIQLHPQDAVFLATDGLFDQFGEATGKRYGTRRFKDFIVAHIHEPITRLRALLNQEWKEWKGDSEQLDDVTVFGLRVSEAIRVGD